ncbi:formimidoylglutamase [Arthrobacter sp. ISL-28]|uniref:formimidoylglutamase n=1 Tax=Arthrobacter sp. ISL-28 TaxID=2819108 RepID=UPI001BE54F5A|nr:formimidoylglutamase [Arthrobacter sp. ISL-28]MBT2520246.1 formimidoylglutamase [Arthrobacter sp. ISL-28]
MDFPALAVDVHPHSWTGRFDGDGEAHRRWWQAVTPYGEVRSGVSPFRADPPVRVAPPVSASSAAGVAPSDRPARPAVVLGFCSDEGVRRNKGRTGAAKAPAAIRSALGPLAFHLGRPVLDAGDVAVRDGQLEAGQARAGVAVSALLDAGNLTLLLGGGHETAFASYLGVAGSEAVRGGKRLGVLNLDAHFDLRDEAAPSSGTPFLQMARAEAAAGRELKYAVVGLSEPNNTQALFNTAHRLGVKYLVDEDCTPDAVHAFVADFLADIDVLYLTIDLDVLPAAVAPGVSAPAAFGVPLRIISAACRQAAASGKLLHADVAELNPAFDVDGRTALVAARLINTLLA